MTRLQFDNVSYKLSNLIDKQACACIKATFDSENFNRFFEADHGIDYDYSYMGNHTVYVYVLVLNDPKFEGLDNIREFAGYIISTMAFDFMAKKIECM